MTYKNIKISFVLVAALCLSLCGCNPAGANWQYKESARIKSPDSLFEAVIFTGDGGATTSIESFLYIVPTGEVIDPKDMARNKACFEADHLKNLKILWKAARLVEIQYEEARIDHFQNSSFQTGAKNIHSVIELRLTPKNADFSLPVQDRVF